MIISTLLLAPINGVLAQGQNNQQANVVSSTIRDCTPEKSKEMQLNALNRESARFDDVTIPGSFSSINEAYQFVSSLETRARNALLDAMATAETICNTGQPPSPDNSNVGQCRQAVQPFTSALNDFLQGCTSAGLGSKKDCMEAVSQCFSGSAYSSSISSDDSTSIASGLANEISRAVRGEESVPASFRRVAPTVGSARSRYEHCPPLASEGLDDWREQVDKAQSSAERAQDEVIRLQGELAQLEIEKAEAIQKLTQQKEDTTEKAKTELEALQADLEAKDLEITQAIVKIDEEIMTAQERIFVLMSEERPKAQLERQQALADISLKCDQDAIAKVTQMRTQRLELIAKSEFTAGGFNQLLSGVGLNNMQRAEYWSNFFYTDCKRQRGYIRPKEMIENSFELALKRIDTEIQRITRQIQQARVRQQMINIDQRNLMLANFERRRENLMRNHDRTIERISQNIQTTNQRFDTRISQARQKLMVAARRAAERDDFMRQKTAYHAEKLRLSNSGRDLASSDLNKLLSGYTKIKTESHNLLFSCDCCNNRNQPGCDSALRILEGMEGELHRSACDGIGGSGGSGGGASNVSS